MHFFVINNEPDNNLHTMTTNDWHLRIVLRLQDDL
jgi:hypothetical protein